MRRERFTNAARRAWSRDRITTFLDVCAAGAIAAGAAMIYRPAGLIAAGLLVGLLSYLNAPGRSEGPPE